MALSFRRTSILVLGEDSLADLVVVSLRREGHRARRLDPLDALAPDKANTLTLLDSAALDPARTPVLILADPPDAPTLVTQLLTHARKANRQHQAGGRLAGRRGWPGRPRLVQRLILMHPRDPAPALPAPEPGDPLRIETFAIEDRAARAVLRRWPPHLGLDPGFGQVPHLLLLGFAPPARALLLQALRLAHYGQGRPRISLVCDHHEAIAADLLAAYPQAHRIADLGFAPLKDLSRLLRATVASDPGSPSPANPPVTLALVCMDDTPTAHPEPGDPTIPQNLPTADHASNFGLARSAVDLASNPIRVSSTADLRSIPGLIPATADQVSNPGLARSAVESVGHPGLALARRLIDELAAVQGVSTPVLLEVGDAEPGGVIDDWDGQIIPFAYRREACRAALLLDGVGDELARTIHEHYCDTIAAQGRDLTQEPAGQPWERLATSYRQANRHQADHVWAKLAVTDCRAVAEELVEAFALSPLEVERLAMVEHERWAADRYLDGWSYGPARDNARKLHPQLIPYADLSEAMKDLDRFAVRGLPTLAARLGLGIQRLLILGVHSPGAACPTGKPLRSLATALGEGLRERYPDRALVIATTLTDARERDLARVLMAGAEPAGLFLLLPRPLSQLLARLSPPAARRDFLDLLTQAERRISLRGAAEMATWFARRAEIHLILNDQSPEIRAIADGGETPNKCILLNPDGAGLTWTFDY